LDLLENALELTLRAHERMHMLDRAHLGILDSRRLRDRRKRFAGCIRDQMQVEVTRLGVGHLLIAFRVIPRGAETDAGTLHRPPIGQQGDQQVGPCGSTSTSVVRRTPAGMVPSGSFPAAFPRAFTKPAAATCRASPWHESTFPR